MGGYPQNMESLREERREETTPDSEEQAASHSRVLLTTPIGGFGNFNCDWRTV